MTVHWADAAALRVIRRHKAEAQMALAEARKREHDGAGWEARHDAERLVEHFTELDDAVANLCMKVET